MLATEKTTQKSTPRITASLQCYGFVLAISFTYLYFALFLSPRVPFLLGGDQAFY